MNEPNVFQFLTATAEIAGLVGDRVFPELLPQHVYEDRALMPAVVFAVSAVDRQKLFCGTDSLVAWTVTINSISPRYDEAVALADAIRRRLVDYSGLMGDVKVDTVVASTVVGGNPDPEPGLFQRVATYVIWFKEGR